MTLWCLILFSPFSLFSSWLAGLFYLSFPSLCSNSSPSFSNVLLSVEPLAQKLDRTTIVWFGPGLNLSFFCLGLPFWSCLHARCFFGKLKLKKEKEYEDEEASNSSFWVFKFALENCLYVCLWRAQHIVLRLVMGNPWNTRVLFRRLILEQSWIRPVNC